MLVTGAGGFIGSHLTEALLRSGHDVRALVHYNSLGGLGHLEAVSEDLVKKLEVCPDDICDSSAIADLVSGMDLVFHLAALVGIPHSYHAPRSYVATNVLGTLNVLEACRRARVARLVVTSTSEVYGTARYLPMDEAHPLQAQSPYAASKISADKLAESYFRSFDVPVVVLRPFNTYGPRQSARAVIPTVLTQAMSGADEIVLGNLAPQRDLTFVDDTVRAFLLAGLTAGIEGELIHFGQGEAVSIAELAQRCLEVVGSNARVRTVPERQRPQKSEVGLLVCDASRAHERLGWTPRVALGEGLRRTADYLRQKLSRHRPEHYAL